MPRSRFSNVKEAQTQLQRFLRNHRHNMHLQLNLPRLNPPVNLGVNPLAAAHIPKTAFRVMWCHFNNNGHLSAGNDVFPGRRGITFSFKHENVGNRYFLSMAADLHVPGSISTMIQVVVPIFQSDLQNRSLVLSVAPNQQDHFLRFAFDVHDLDFENKITWVGHILNGTPGPIPPDPLLDIFGTLEEFACLNYFGGRYLGPVYPPNPHDPRNQYDSNDDSVIAYRMH